MLGFSRPCSSVWWGGNMRTGHCLIAAALSLAFMSVVAFAQPEPSTPPPLLLRIKMATVATPDIAKLRAMYTTWLGYKVREAGTVSNDLAASWGAPKASGHRYVLMSSDGSPDVFIRAVEESAVPNYRPMTTWGWNSFEIIIDDIDAVYAKIQKSPFTIIGTPKPLFSSPTIHAMQVKGPANEVLYLTTQTGDRSASRLPLPGALIGRPFIIIIASADLSKLRDWYGDTFQMAKSPLRESPIGVLRDAQGLPDGMFGITTLSLKDHGNLLELDGYPSNTKERPRLPGQLPPGNAIATFTVADLDKLPVHFIVPPRRLYGEHRAATVVGPAGELIELIEDKGS